MYQNQPRDRVEPGGGAPLRGSELASLQSPVYHLSTQRHPPHVWLVTLELTHVMGARDILELLDPCLVIQIPGACADQPRIMKRST